MQTRSGIPHSTTSPTYLLNARHTAMTALPIADLRLPPPYSDVPSDCTFTMSKSNGDFSARDLYIESLEESLALAHDYMTNASMTAPAPTPVVDPMTTLRLDMDAQHKQFKLLLRQNLDLIAVFAKASASPNPVL
jgi:hypothetical protein